MWTEGRYFNHNWLNQLSFYILLFFRTFVFSGVREQQIFLVEMHLVQV